MTNLLKEAFAKAALLPVELQDSLAQTLLTELEAEFQWDDNLAKSQRLLDELAEQALKEDKEGKTRSLGFDEL